MPPPDTDRPKKRRRVTVACDYCHRRSTRCRPSAQNPQEQCQLCWDFDEACTYNRPSKRGRGNARNSPQDQSPNAINPPAVPTNAKLPAVVPNATASFQGHSDLTGAYGVVREGRVQDTLGTAWRSFALSSSATIHRYLEIYMEIVYPIFPLFHGPTLWDKVRAQHHLTDRGFFASVLAACALAAARARDGAAKDKFTGAESSERSSEIFFAAAQDAILKDLSKAQGLDFLRACGLLSLTSMQYGQIKTMQQFLGHYSTLSSMQHFHNETRWPSNLSVVEKEERRRLFWSMYTLDIYSSVVFDSLMKSQETASNVRYPTETKDESLTSDSVPRDDDCWLRGWNFTTDLYRVLEHLVKRLRRTHLVRDDCLSVVQIMVSDIIPGTEIMDRVLGLYSQLPDRFKTYDGTMTGDKSKDIYGFQAANIQATLQLVRMIVFSIDPTPDVDHKCSVAEQVLNTFHDIDPDILRAISTPLVYHLGGIGKILASITIGLLNESSYQRVRALLVSMADLLGRLESGLGPAVGASQSLRSQIQKIDEYVDTQRRLNTATSQAQLRNRSTVGNQSVDTLNNEGSLQVTDPGGLDLPFSLDEFQLPADLTNDGAWPWPFFMTPEPQGPIATGFE